MNSISIISGLVGILVGSILGFIFDRHIIKYQEYKSLAKDVRFIFVEIRKNISDNKNNFNFSVSHNINNQLSDIDLAMNKLLSSCSFIKRVRIKKKYNQFKFPYSKYCDENIKKYSLNIYDFIDNEFLEYFPKIKAKNGKELAINKLDKLVKIIK